MRGTGDHTSSPDDVGWSLTKLRNRVVFPRQHATDGPRDHGIFVGAYDEMPPRSMRRLRYLGDNGDGYGIIRDPRIPVLSV